MCAPAAHSRISRQHSVSTCYLALPCRRNGVGREGRRGRRDLERSLVPGPGPGTGIQPRVQSGTRGRNPSPVRVPGPGPGSGNIQRSRRWSSTVEGRSQQSRRRSSRVEGPAAASSPEKIQQSRRENTLKSQRPRTLSGRRNQNWSNWSGLRCGRERDGDGDDDGDADEGEDEEHKAKSGTPWPSICKQEGVCTCRAWRTRWRVRTPRSPGDASRTPRSSVAASGAVVLLGVTRPRAVRARTSDGSR